MIRPFLLWIIVWLHTAAVAQSDTHRQKIVELLGHAELTDAYALTDSTIVGMQREGLQWSEETWAIFREELLLEGFNTLLDSTVLLAQAYYTEADADTLIAFMNTSTGRKYLAEAERLEPTLQTMRERWIQPILYRTESRVFNLHQQRFNAVVDSCALHRTGTFLNLGSRGNAVTIERTADRQVEYENGVTLYSMAVEWEGPCRYNLYSLAEDGTIDDEHPIRVNIYQAGKDDYYYIAKSTAWSSGGSGNYQYGHIVHEHAYRAWLQRDVEQRQVARGKGRE